MLTLDHESYFEHTQQETAEFVDGRTGKVILLLISPATTCNKDEIVIIAGTSYKVTEVRHYVEAIRVVYTIKQGA